jgi:hypothetical protein
MLFSYPIEFEIPDSWLLEAGCILYKPLRLAYLATSDPKWPTVNISIQQIQAPMRDLGITGLHKERTISLLGAYLNDNPLPPVEVHELPDRKEYYEVRNGYHRYYTSVAFGFTSLPVSIRPYFKFT